MYEYTSARRSFSVVRERDGAETAAQLARDLPACLAAIGTGSSDNTLPQAESYSPCLR